MITYKTEGKERLEQIKPLWWKLRDYHRQVSAHFPQDFETDNYTVRKEKLMKKEALQVLLAYDNQTLVGYLLASYDAGTATIESLYVDENYRGQAIGDGLMLASIKWLESFEPEVLQVSVAYGNQVMSFYEKFGFLPRSIILKTSADKRHSA